MAEDPIRQIWKSEEKEEPMSSAEIADALRPRIGHGELPLRLSVWYILAVALVTLVLEGMNIAGYARNTPMLSAHVAAALVTFGIAGYGVLLTGHIGVLSRRDRSLAETVRAQLAFVRVHFEIWLWLGAVAQALFVFAITTLTDNQAGIYRINQPLVFWGGQVCLLLFFYGIWKIASLPVVQELRATLEDLQLQLLEKTVLVDRQKRHWRRWGILLTLLFLILFLLGIWQAARIVALRAGSLL
jgi:hypothetical protein